MSDKAKYLTNAHVMREYPDGFGVFSRQKLWSVKRDDEGILRLTMQADTPALVMNTQYAEPYKSFTKRQYQSVHNGSADDSLRAEILGAYGLDLETFKSELRTVGCGTNIYMQCDDGLYQVCVQRTAPSQTPEGVVQPGAFSRAAGGATGSLLETQTREMIEEMNAFVKIDGHHVVSVDLVRSDNLVSIDTQKRFFAEKHGKLAEIYEQVASRIEAPIISLSSEKFEAHAIYVNDLHEMVEEEICGARKQFKAVVADDPKNGDLSGVDSILVVPMPGIKSTQIVISDGERDQQGNLLNRTWMLAKPEFLEANHKAGTMKFSPVLGKILASTQTVLTEIQKFNP